jgi:hypothetical protein
MLLRVFQGSTDSAKADARRDAAAAVNKINEIVAQVNIRDDLLNKRKNFEDVLRHKEHEIKEWEEFATAARK